MHKTLEISKIHFHQKTVFMYVCTHPYALQGRNKQVP